MILYFKITRIGSTFLHISVENHLLIVREIHSDPLCQNNDTSSDTVWIDRQGVLGTMAKLFQPDVDTIEDIITWLPYSSLYFFFCVHCDSSSIPIPILFYA